MTRRLLYAALAAMVLLHHDFWYWNDATLVFGFLPVGVAYHSAYSLVTGLLWLLVALYAWPSELEDFAHGDGDAKHQESRRP